LERWLLSTGEIMLRYTKYVRQDGTCPYSMHQTEADADLHLAELRNQAMIKHGADSYVNMQIQSEMF
jgi:hypothetical protein